MTAAADAMADRVRPLLPVGLVEKKMFGGVGFMLDGNMALGTTGEGALLVRLSAATLSDVLQRPGAYEPHMGARVMKGFVAVDETGTSDEASLQSWIDHAVAFVRTLPPK